MYSKIIIRVDGTDYELMSEIADFILSKYPQIDGDEIEIIIPQTENK